MNPKRIRLSPEYGTWPTWDDETGAPLDYSTLVVPASLKERIDAWDAKYQATLNQNYPPDSAFPTKAVLEEYLREGEEIRNQLQLELPESEILFNKEIFEDQFSG